MHEDFWHARWARNEIGFHLGEVNPWLRKYWPALDLPAGSRVLVPLCGKSLDMIWLLAQGHRVLGVELSQLAVEAFFAEQGLPFTVDEQGAFRCYRAGALELWCGDFFALGTADVADCTALYDRAALIALPSELHRRYVAHVAAILPEDCRGLLISLDYPPEEMQGPPFPVPESEVHELLGPFWQIESMVHADVLGENWRFAERGLSALQESVYRLHRR
jgi:thiopurine S-methyltransferase